NAAGRDSEPAVCVPSANGTMPLATAAAEPLLEPPGVWAGFQALVVADGPPQLANSVVVVLPSSRAFCSRSFRTTVASIVDTSPAITFEPASVGQPAAWKMSLAPYGTPNSGGSSATRVMTWSRRRA